MDFFVLKSVSMPADWMRALCCSVPTEKALGMVTACDVRCVCDVPNYTSALRDGWAVRSADNGQTRTAAWKTAARTSSFNPVKLSGSTQEATSRREPMP